MTGFAAWRVPAFERRAPGGQGQGGFADIRHAQSKMVDRRDPGWRFVVLGLDQMHQVLFAGVEPAAREGEVGTKAEGQAENLHGSSTTNDSAGFTAGSLSSETAFGNVRQAADEVGLAGRDHIRVPVVHNARREHDIVEVHLVRQRRREIRVG